MKNTLINIALALGSVTAFLLVIEFGLRVTGLQSAAPNPPKIYQQSQNPDISYELQPNLKNEKAYKATVSTDEHGFRTNGAESKGTDTLIAVLGDSIAFGHGVHDNESLPARMEQHNADIRFINAAVPGYQLQQETAVYTEKVAPLNPDGVVLVFYWNDLNGEAPGILDNKGILRAHDWKPEDDICRPITEGILGLVPGKCWLDTHSAFYKAVKKVLNLKASKKTQEEERSEPPKIEPFLEEELAVYIRDLRTLSEQLPEKRWLVIWPDNYIHLAYRQKLSIAAKQYGFAVIDLYDLFGNDVETLSWDTVHPSPLSLQVAARYILARITQRL